VIELDALRALAAINLMLFHFTHVYQVKYGFTTALGFELPYGKYGVQLFFMLSGFVNAMTLCRKPEGDEFIASRLIRILPLFLLVVGINLVLLTMQPLSQHSSLSFSQTVANATLMPNLFGFDCYEPVTWTLQVEVLFYGILVAFFLSGGLNKPCRPLILYLLLCLVGGLLIEHMPPDATHTFSGGLVLLLGDILLFKYMPLFAIGIFLHHLKSSQMHRWSSQFGILIAATVFHLVDDHGHNPAATVMLIGLLTLAAYGRLPLFRSGLFVFLSGISYSLYLLHNNLGCVLMYHLNQKGVPPQICFGLAFLFSIAIATAVTYWVERPVTARLRNRWKQVRPQLKAWFEHLGYRSPAGETT
jgi:peptidoglycan/LPS O-acetylase OafA/YrhL